MYQLSTDEDKKTKLNQELNTHNKHSALLVETKPERSYGLGLCVVPSLKAPHLFFLYWIEKLKYVSLSK